MARPWLVLFAFVGLASAAGPPVPEPLPGGAIRRHGTARFRHGGLVRALAFSRDGKTLYSSSHDHTVSAWDVATGHECGRYAWADPEPTALAVPPDGGFPAIGKTEGWLRETHPRGGGVFVSYDVRVAKGAIEALAYSPDGKRLAIGSDDGGLFVQDSGGKKVSLRHTLDCPVHCLAWSADGKLLATNAAEKAVAVWDTTTGKLARSFGDDSIQCLAFAPSGTTLVTREAGGVFRAWDAASGKELQRWGGEPEGGGAAAAIYQIAFSHDGKAVYSGNVRGGIDLWDIETGKRKSELRGRHEGRVTAVALSPRGDVLASGGADHAIHSWRTGEGVPLTPPSKPIDVPEFRTPKLNLEPDNPVVALGTAVNGKLLATSHRDGSLWLRDATGVKRRQLGSDLGQAQPILSPDGSLVTVVGREALVRVWDARTGKAHEPLAGHRGGTLAAAFSADGKRLATGGRDEAMRIWDVAKGKAVNAPARHSAWVSAVAISPDGRRVATGTVRGEVLVWSAETGAKLATFTGHRGAVHGLCFTTDGKALTSASRDTTVLVWDVAKLR